MSTSDYYPEHDIGAFSWAHDAFAGAAQQFPLSLATTQSVGCAPLDPKCDVDGLLGSANVNSQQWVQAGENLVGIAQQRFRDQPYGFDPDVPLGSRQIAAARAMDDFDSTTEEVSGAGLYLPEHNIGDAGIAAQAKNMLQRQASAHRPINETDGDAHAEFIMQSTVAQTKMGETPMNDGFQGSTDRMPRHYYLDKDHQFSVNPRVNLQDFEAHERNLSGREYYQHQPFEHALHGMDYDALQLKQSGSSSRRLRENVPRDIKVGLGVTLGVGLASLVLIVGGAIVITKIVVSNKKKNTAA